MYNLKGVDYTMNEFDMEWSKVVKNIIYHGQSENRNKVRARYSDGMPAPSIYSLGQTMYFAGDSLPITQTKKLSLKAPLRELFWIWVRKSNVVQDLRDMGSTIWDEWENDNGTIGPAYGYILGKKCRRFPVKDLLWDKLSKENVEFYKNYIKKVDSEYVFLDQVDYLIHQLILNPTSRRNMTSLWNIDDLDRMSLEPCVWKTNWIMMDNKLNLIVGVRSNDMCLGNPFNVYQYYVLQRLIAQVVDIPAGFLMFNIDNAHIYDRHLDQAIEMMLFDKYDYPEPSLWINPNIKNLYEFDVDKDIKVLNYISGPERSFEVAK